MSGNARRPRAGRDGGRTRGRARSAERGRRLALPVRRRPRGHTALPLAARRRRLFRGLAPGAAAGARYGFRVDGPVRPWRAAIVSTPRSCSPTPTPSPSTGRSASTPRCSSSARTAGPSRRRRSPARRRAGEPGGGGSRPRRSSSTSSTCAASPASTRQFPERAARNFRRARPSRLDRASRRARRDRGRDHAGRRLCRRAASAAARTRQRLGLQFRRVRRRPTRALRPAAGRKCARRPTRSMPPAWRRSSTSSSTTTARATSSGRPSRSAASTTRPSSASIRTIRREYINDAGTGNCVALDRPLVVEMAIGALRRWMVHGGIDGFRFDLATALGRSRARLRPAGAVLRGAGRRPGRLAGAADRRALGHRPGRLPARPLRPGLARSGTTTSATRRAASGAAIRACAARSRRASPARATCSPTPRRRRRASISSSPMTASPSPTSSPTSGSTTRPTAKDNRDGTDANCSWNHGVEGPSADPDVIVARGRATSAIC